MNYVNLRRFNLFLSYDSSSFVSSFNWFGIAKSISKAYVLTLTTFIYLFIYSSDV